MIFITNAPYPADAVQRFLDRLGVRRDAYDAIISSGDVTRGIVEERRAQRVFHLGPHGPPHLRRPRGRFRACRDRRLRGLLRPVRRQDETPENYREHAGTDARTFTVHGLRQSRHRRRARRQLVYCAGALADAYVALGGEALYCGKPHAPIYEAALCKAAAFATARCRRLPGSSRSAIRSSTDLKGAAAFGVDFLFVISGLHADEFGLREAPDLAGVFAAGARAQGGHSPTYVVIVRLFFEHHCVRIRAVRCHRRIIRPKRNRVFQNFISAMPRRRHSQSSGGLPGPPSSQVTAYCLQ